MALDTVTLEDALRLLTLPRTLGELDGEPVTAQTARKWLYGGALPTQDKVRTLAQWLEVSPHWLRYGEAERAHTAAKQDSAIYAVDSAWLGKKFDSLSEPHRKMVLEITRALLRLEGKQ